MKKQWFSALLALALLLGIACGCAAPGEDVSGDESGLGVILEDMVVGAEEGGELVGELCVNAGRQNGGVFSAGDILMYGDIVLSVWVWSTSGWSPI